MLAKILCVDDDLYILEGYKRQLRKMFDIYIALDGESAINIIKEMGPFAVVVTDMNMPEMNGVELLKRIRKIAPETVRIMLTGMADLQISIDAVNEGYVFRFLTKPCRSDVFMDALSAGIIQYRLIIAEKELQEKTLTGIIKVLIDILENVNYAAFSRAMRIKNYVMQLASMLKLKNLWQYEVAALLSQIGCVMVPPDIFKKVLEGKELHKQENELLQTHTEIGGELIASIPRLEAISKMITNQNQSFNKYDRAADHKRNPVSIGAQLLKVAADLDMLLERSLSIEETIQVLKSRSNEYNPEILPLLYGIKIPVYDTVMRMIKAKDLSPGMFVAESIFSRSGTLILSKGKELTETSILRIRNFVEHDIIPDIFKIMLPETQFP